MQQAPALPVQVPTVGQEPRRPRCRAPSLFPLCRVGLAWLLSQKVNVVVSKADAVLIALTVSGSEAETSVTLSVTVASGSKRSLPSPFPSDSSLLSPSPASPAGEQVRSGHRTGMTGLGVWPSAMKVWTGGGNSGASLEPPSASAPLCPSTSSSPATGLVFRVSGPYQADMAHTSRGQGFTDSCMHRSLLCPGSVVMGRKGEARLRKHSPAFLRFLPPGLRLPPASSE